MDTGIDETIRCAAWARGVDLSLAGTAATTRGFVVVDWPLPWPRDLQLIPELAQVAEQSAQLGLRLQGRVPIDNSTVLTCYRQAPDLNKSDDGGEETEERRSNRPDRRPSRQASNLVVDQTDFSGSTPAAALAELLAGEPGWMAPTDYRGELLICTHGSRDVCCGAEGTRLQMALEESNELSRAVGRTSHTGGHRFAPTALLLPEGTLWGFLDQESAVAICEGRGEPSEMGDHYRGCSTMPSREAQVLEVGVFKALGWDLFSATRRAEQTSGGPWRLTIEHGSAPDGSQDNGSAPDGSRGDGSAPDRALEVWEGVVEAGRTLQVPDCGAALVDAHKTETELHLRDLRRVS